MIYLLTIFRGSDGLILFLRDLYLDGNDLECEGVMELIQRCADKAENEAFERDEMARKKAEQEAEEEAMSI